MFKAPNTQQTQIMIAFTRTTELIEASVSLQ